MCPNLSFFLTKILLLMNMFQRIDQRAGHLINLIIHGINSAIYCKMRYDPPAISL
jgi:hypothetical protein